MKSIAFLAFLALSISIANGQSLIGTWQLVKQTNCMQEEIGSENPETDELIEDMHTSQGGTNSVIRFKDNTNGEENIRMLGSRRSSKLTSFLYKYDGTNLYFLDKKSKLLLGSYTVESFTGDSLIFSNAAKACETKVFVKVSDKK